MAPLSCCEQTQPRCPPTPARKDTGGGEDRDTHRFLLVFTFGSSLPTSELDTSLWSAERERGRQGWGLAAIALAGPGARTPSRLTGSWAVGSGLARLPPARPSVIPQRRKLAASSAGTSPLATGHCAAAGTGVGGAEDGNLRRAPPPPFPRPTRARMRPLVHVCLASLRATTRPGSLFVHCKERWGRPCTWHALHRWLRGDFKKPD